MNFFLTNVTSSSHENLNPLYPFDLLSKANLWIYIEEKNLEQKEYEQNMNFQDIWNAN
jgi:hypothetical protein